MKEYLVTVPFTGYVEVIIEAEDEKSAKTKFYDLEISNLDEAESKGIIEMYSYDFHEQICKGNILYADVNNMGVKEL